MYSHYGWIHKNVSAPLCILSVNEIKLLCQAWHFTFSNSLAFRLLQLVSLTTDFFWHIIKSFSYILMKNFLVSITTGIIFLYWLCSATTPIHSPVWDRLNAFACVLGHKIKICLSIEVFIEIIFSAPFKIYHLKLKKTLAYLGQHSWEFRNKNYNCSIMIEYHNFGTGQQVHVYLPSYAYLQTGSENCTNVNWSTSNL